MLRIIPDKKLLLSLAAACLFGSTSAHAVTAGGYAFDETARTGSQELRLNGAGLRYKMIFSVYSAGLYLGEKKIKSALLGEDGNS